MLIDRFMFTYKTKTDGSIVVAETFIVAHRDETLVAQWTVINVPTVVFQQRFCYNVVDNVVITHCHEGTKRM